uniref:Uncharacterized protein n=1 Tax=Cacopsylla melanoneura TaxID=428564 RepID=A0A8D8UPR7_9HEMI
MFYRPRKRIEKEIDGKRKSQPFRKEHFVLRKICLVWESNPRHNVPPRATITFSTNTHPPQRSSKNNMQSFVKAAFVMTLLLGYANAGPIAAGICYAGCAGVTVACFSATGFTFGTVPGSVIAATPALAACNTAFGACEAA